MLKVTGREERGWLDEESINNFPCKDLRTIDQLWVKYSKGHFGFSVQKRIWIECGGQLGNDDVAWVKFCDRIGWGEEDSLKSYNELTFSLNTPGGHLPSSCLFVGGVVVVFVDFGSLFSHVETCKL